MFRFYLIRRHRRSPLACPVRAALLGSPFRDCRRCDGLGRRRTRTHILAARRRPCRRCRTTGKRLRVGRHVANYLTATRRAAHADRANRTTTTVPPTPTGARR